MTLLIRGGEGGVQVPHLVQDRLKLPVKCYFTPIRYLGLMGDVTNWLFFRTIEKRYLKAMLVGVDLVMIEIRK